MVDQTLKQHEELIDKHDTRLDSIQQDLIDIKTRLGIKDLTNGQVIEYQKQLVKALEDEKIERKANDEKLDERLWFITTGIIISVLLEIGLFLFKGG